MTTFSLWTHSQKKTSQQLWLIPGIKHSLIELLNGGDSADPEDYPSDGTTSDLDISTGTNPATCVEGFGVNHTTSLTQSAVDTPNRLRSGNPPPAKRRKEDNESSTSGLFDPVLAGEEEEEYQFVPPKMICTYLEKHFRCSLTKKERKVMLKADPKPQTPVTFPPNVDEYLGVFW